MKHIFLIALVGFAFLQSCKRGEPNSPPTADVVPAADSLVIPAPVLSTFHNRFPAAADAKWEMEGTEYEVTFRDSVSEKSIIYDAAGTEIKSETSVNSNSLPEGVLQYVKDNLAGKTIDQAYMVVTAQGSITYEIEVEGKDYVFGGDGKFQKIEEPEGDETD